LVLVLDFPGAAASCNGNSQMKNEKDGPSTMTVKQSPIQFLRDKFATISQQDAFVFNGKSFSYDWLTHKINDWQAELHRLGVREGQIVAVTGDYSPEICALALALVEHNTVFVPFASVVGHEQIELSKIANVSFEFTFQRGVLQSAQPIDQPVSNTLLAAFLKLNDPGLVVFSSGSTGFQKGILHNFSKILDKFKTPRKSLRTLTFLQLDHLGGINTLLHTLSNGGTVISISDRSPVAICRAVETFKIELLPVTPSFLNLMMVSGDYKKHDLSSLKVISYGTEVMPESTFKRVREVFPGILLQQTYGLSELGVLRTKSRDDGSLWVKVGGEGFETKVVNHTLWIRAHSAMVGYLNAPQPFDSEGWFNTDDQVEVDGDYLKILGRESDMINVGGQKVSPSEVESVLMQIDNIKDAAVMGEKHALMGHIVVAKVILNIPEELDTLKSRIRAFCKERLSAYKIHMKVEIVTKQLYNARFKRVRTLRSEASSTST
jgi:long-chain acyl-CoA synthetase